VAGIPLTSILSPRGEEEELYSLDPRREEGAEMLTSFRPCGEDVFISSSSPFRGED